jgi:hypothetical protein
MRLSARKQTGLNAAYNDQRTSEYVHWIIPRGFNWLLVAIYLGMGMITWDILLMLRRRKCRGKCNRNDYSAKDRSLLIFGQHPLIAVPNMSALSTITVLILWHISQAGFVAPEAHTAEDSQGAHSC